MNAANERLTTDESFAPRLTANHGRRAGGGSIRRVLAGTLDLYKKYLSPLLPRACRFAPTCSEYAKLAILEHGILRGVLLAAGRLMRCHPLHPGGIDLP